MEARDIIKRPVITERSSELLADKKYTFEVDTRANKTQVKDAVEQIFDVKVEKVNVLNYKGKFKRVGKFGGYTNKRRKAIDGKRILQLQPCATRPSHASDPHCSSNTRFLRLSKNMQTIKPILSRYK